MQCGKGYDLGRECRLLRWYINLGNEYTDYYLLHHIHVLDMFFYIFFGSMKCFMIFKEGVTFKNRRKETS